MVIPIETGARSHWYDNDHQPGSFRYGPRHVSPSPKRITCALSACCGLDFVLRETSAGVRQGINPEFIAQDVGVTDEVRILSVRERSWPAQRRYWGLSAGYGVIVRLDCTDNLRLLAHEFVYVARCERQRREGFLQEYIRQSNGSRGLGRKSENRPLAMPFLVTRKPAASVETPTRFLLAPRRTCLCL
jgi:hypothetical protein